MQRNQRQKKKSSQAKKRYYDTTKAKDSKIHQEKPSSDQQKDTDTQSKEPVQATRDLDATSSVRDYKKYSKRKVASNWDRYKLEDEGEGQAGSSSRTWESEEQLQQRLVQLLNLPVHHSPLSAIEHTVTDEAYSSVGSSFLSLDCESLALSLSSLPLHERLDISQELLELSQSSGNDSRVIISDSNVQNVKLSPKEERTARDLKTALTRQNQQQKNSHSEFKFQIPPTSEVPVGTQERSKHHQSQEQVQSDKELDSLLKLSAPLNTRQQHEQTTKEKVEVTVEDTRSVPPQLCSETDELDEMLDELLA